MSRPLQRRDAAHPRDAALGPSMTPMVDVVLVILIFFMASTTFLGPEWLLRSALFRPPNDQGGDPDAAFRLPPASFRLVLSVDEGGLTRVQGMGLDRASVDQGVARLGEYAARLGADQLTVVLEPTPQTPYRDVVRLHEACAELGIEGVGLN